MTKKKKAVIRKVNGKDKGVEEISYFSAADVDAATKKKPKKTNDWSDVNTIAPPIIPYKDEEGYKITSVLLELEAGAGIMSKNERKKKRVHGVDYSDWRMSWIDMETEPKTGKTEITGWGGYDKEEIEEMAKQWNAINRVWEAWKPELIEPDQSYARKKRVPKEWQKEWQ